MDEPTTKRRKMSDDEIFLEEKEVKRPWKKSCQLKTVALYHAVYWRTDKVYVPILYEDEVGNRLCDWLGMILHCHAIIVISSNMGYSSFAKYYDNPYKRNVEIMKVGGLPRLVAIFSENEGFMKHNVYNRNLEELLQTECDEKQLRAVRPRSGPPKPVVDIESD